MSPKTIFFLAALALLCSISVAHTQHTLRARLSGKKVAQAELAQYPKDLNEDEVKELSSTYEHRDPFDSPAGPARPNNTLANVTIYENKAVRKNVLHLSHSAQAEYFEALQALKDEEISTPKHLSAKKDHGLKWNTYDYLAYKWNSIVDSSKSIKSGVLALPFRRAYLRYVEKELQRVSGTDVTIPYWDWSNRFEATKVFTDPLFGGNGTEPDYVVENGEFKSWSQKVNWKNNHLVSMGITRKYGIADHETSDWMDGADKVKTSSFGTKTTARTTGGDRTNKKKQVTPEQKQSGTFPSACDVLEACSLDTYYSGPDQCQPTFSMALLELEKEVMSRLGGDMLTLPANDPLSLSIYAYTDKLFMMWQSFHVNATVTDNTYGYPEGDLDTVLEFVGSTPREELDWGSLKYYYEADDTIDEKYSRFNSDGKNMGMCQGWLKSTGGVRTFSKYCHKD